MIVPSLVLVTRMGVHRAVATSLLIIAVIGSAGAAAAVWRGQMNLSVLAPFAAGGSAMMIVTRSFAARIAGPTLQKTFAICMVLVGLGMLAEGLLHGR